ncbi:MAG: serine acetyltransferase [bacterium]
MDKRQLGKVSRKLAGICRKSKFFRCASRYSVPSDESVKEILALFQEVLFIGYFGKQDIPDWDLEPHLHVHMSELFDALSSQIAKSLVHECQRPREGCDLCQAHGEENAAAVIGKIPEIRRLLEGDVQAAFDGDPAAKSFDEIIFSYPGLRAIMVHRVAHELYLLEVPLLPRIMSEYAHAITGIDIHPGATIGRNFFIDHGTGVVIGETTLIGDNVKIYQGVTLGALSFPKDERGNLLRDIKRHPTLEDNVTVYSGTTILGGDTVIGRGSTVGGNVWLTTSVPPGTKVVIKTPELRMKGELIGHARPGESMVGVRAGKSGRKATAGKPRPEKTSRRAAGKKAAGKKATGKKAAGKKAIGKKTSRSTAGGKGSGKPARKRTAKRR